MQYTAPLGTRRSNSSATGWRWILLLGVAVAHLVFAESSYGTGAAVPSLQAARTLIAQGEFARAATMLKQVREKNAAAKLPEQDEVAFYSGLCSEALGEAVNAKKWYALAQSLAEENKHQDRLPLYYLAHASASVPASPRRVVSLRHEMISLNEDENDDQRAHERFLSTAKIQLDKAQKAYKKGDEPRLISLMAWSLIYAELASFPEVSLYSTSIDHFQKGWKHLVEIEVKMKNNPNLDKMISEPENIAVAMQLDAVSVRLEKIMAKNEKSLLQQTERIEKLKELAKEYRASTEHMSVALTHSLLRDNFAAKRATEDAQKAVDAVAQIVDSTKKKKDYFLFEPEPAQNDPYARPAEDQFLAFSKSFEAHFNALQGMLIFTDIAADPGKPNKLTLTKVALPLAQKALDADSGHLLGHYTIALIHEALGVAAGRVNPGDLAEQKTAKNHFEVAKKHLQSFEDEVGKNAPKIGLARINKEVKNRKQELTDTNEILTRAEAFTRAGKLDKAHTVLTEGADRHFDREIWLSRSNADLRGRLNPMEVRAVLETGLQGKILSTEDYRYHLAWGKTVLAELHREMAKTNEPLPEETKKKFSERAATAGTAFKLAHEKSKDASSLALCNAYRSYASALQGNFLPPEDPSADPTLRDAWQLAAESIDGLKKEMKKAESIDLLEGLIAANLAKGHLSVQILPNYNPTAFDSFSEAIIQSEKLPFGNDEWKTSLGGPLLSALKKRSNNAADKFAREERKLRKAFTYFAEGALALHQGSSEAAAKHAAVGLAILDAKTTEDAPAAIDDELPKRLREELIAFKALSELESAKARKESPNAALVTIMTNIMPTLNPGAGEPISKVVERISPEAVDKAIEEIHGRSPVMVYALGQALEEKAVWLRHREHYQDTPATRRLLQQADKTFRRMDKLLTDFEVTVRGRYPLLQSWTTEAIARLENPNFFVEKGLELREQHRLQESREVLRQGLARQVNNFKIWRAFLEVGFDVAEIAKKTDNGPNKEDDEMAALLKTLKKTAPKEAQALLKFWEGHIEERRRNWELAERAFESAEKMATTAEDRDRASARLTLLKLKSIAAR